MPRQFEHLVLASVFAPWYAPPSPAVAWTSPSLPLSSISTLPRHHLVESGGNRPIRSLLPDEYSTRLSSVVGVDGNSFEGGKEEESDLPPLFVETNDTSIQSTINGLRALEGVPPSLMHSIERVRKARLSNSPPPSSDDGADATCNDDLLKRIARAGKQKQAAATNTMPSIHALSFPDMERVPGCVATVHLKISLFPITDSPTEDPNDYRVIVDGTADAILSAGLMSVLLDVFSGGSNHGSANITAADVLSLDPEVLTTAMGLNSVLSRGRNDGMASMVRVVQRQIKALVGTDETRASDVSVRLKSMDEHNKEAKPTVAMLLSGGVDSSVALHLLLRQNYNVTAFYLRIWLEDELAHLGECPWEDDLQVCQAVCEHAGNVPLETVSLGEEYRERVVQYTIEEAQRGRTPNPDIMCNSRVKFGCFLEYVENSGMEFDFVASGHYARLKDEALANGAEHPKKRLFRAPDPIKDQSYFLCALTQQQLSKVLFPIGSFQKSEVRELAARFQLPNRNRPDSQGLCFLGKVRFDDFLASYLGNRPGDVVDALNGEVIGRHNGLWYHTVGQRKGIGKVMFPLATARGPWYVVAKDQKRDIVYVSNRYEEEDFASARSEFEVEDVRWISGEPPREALSDKNGSLENKWKEVRMEMKIRHGPTIVKGIVSLEGDGTTGNIRLDKKDGGLAPGQYVVFYRLGSDECLGAGVISERHWAKFLQSYEEFPSITEAEVI
ncbi:hypothetical protein ACHAWF_006996 [Thalassiosira exigua]